MVPLIPPEQEWTEVSPPVNAGMGLVTAQFFFSAVLVGDQLPLEEQVGGYRGDPVPRVWLKVT
jgi:hypothetical protein